MNRRKGVLDFLERLGQPVRLIFEVGLANLAREGKRRRHVGDGSRAYLGLEFGVDTSNQVAIASDGILHPGLPELRLGKFVARDFVQAQEIGIAHRLERIGRIETVRTERRGHIRIRPASGRDSRALGGLLSRASCGGLYVLRLDGMAARLAGRDVGIWRDWADWGSGRLSTTAASGAATSSRLRSRSIGSRERAVRKELVEVILGSAVLHRRALGRTSGCRKSFGGIGRRTGAKAGDACIRGIAVRLQFDKACLKGLLDVIGIAQSTMRTKTDTPGLRHAFEVVIREVGGCLGYLSGYSRLHRNWHISPNPRHRVVEAGYITRDVQLTTGVLQRLTNDAAAKSIDH